MEKQEIELDIIIYPEEIDGERVYSISSVQIPNVVTQGNTIEQAIERLKEALGLYFEEAPWEKQNLITITKKDHSAPMISRIPISV